MSDTKNNVTINKEYDGNLKKMDTTPGWVHILGSPMGVGLYFVLFTILFTPLCVLGFNYVKQLLTNYKYLVDVLLDALPPIILTSFTYVLTLKSFKNFRRSWKTIKYAKALPKTTADFELIGISSLYDYVMYLRSNIFVQTRTDNIININCPFAEPEDIRESVKAAFMYYTDKKALNPGKDYLNERINSVMDIVNTPDYFLKVDLQFAELRPIYVLFDLLLKETVTKTYVDRNGHLHAICKSNDHVGNGVAVDYDLSEYNGDRFYGIPSKDLEYKIPSTDYSIFNSCSCKIDKSNREDRLVPYMACVFAYMITIMSWFNFFGLLL